MKQTASTTENARTRVQTDFPRVTAVLQKPGTRCARREHKLVRVYRSVIANAASLSDGPDMPVCLGTDPTGTIEYRILSKDRLEEALAVQQLSMHHECIAIGMGMFEDPGAAEEMKLVFREVVKDGCTVIAVDRLDRIVAVAFNKLCASRVLHFLWESAS